MAGGVGSRFWPVSSRECPKQFMDVMGTGRSLLQMTVDRFRGMVPMGNVWVVTSVDYAELVYNQLPEVDRSHVLLEPCRRNTAPCIAYVAWRIKKLNGKANLVVAPSDHVVGNLLEFRRVVGMALEFTAQTDAIVTLGMRPTRAETGYGYIEVDAGSVSLRNPAVLRVDSFREKPDLETARRYVAAGSYYWNSGIFVWNVGTIVNALRVYAPEISEVFERLLPVYGTVEEQACIDRNFPCVPSISIDYAVLEHADEIFVIPADFGWSDVGTWGSLQSLLDRDVSGNAVVGDGVELHESSNCMVHVDGVKRVVIQGLEDFIVAKHDGMLLICKLSEEQRIREWSEETSLNPTEVGERKG